MTPEVAAAIEEIRQAFPDHAVTAEEEPQGGAYVFVHDVLLGKQYTPSVGWIGFQITFQYPYCDIYPHFIDAGVKRDDKQPEFTGISGPTTFHGRSVLQLSRRSYHWDASTDTAAMKLEKVLTWLRSQ